MSLVVYGVEFSTCTQRVITTLKEKGVKDYRIEPVNLMTGAHKKPEHLALQPFGIIPVVKDGDFLVYESRAIARYIAEKFAGQGTDLLGSTPQERGLVNQWLDVESGTYSPQASGLVAEIVFKKVFAKQDADPEKVKHFVEKLGGVLDVYERHLGSTGFPYLTGSNFTLADLSHLPYTQLYVSNGFADIISSRPNVAKWWERISTRESWKEMTAEAAAALAKLPSS